MNRLSSECDQNCQKEKENTLEKIYQFDDMVTEEEETWDKVTEWLEKTAKVFEEIEDFAFNWDAATFDSEVHKKRLVACDS